MTESHAFPPPVPQRPAPKARNRAVAVGLTAGLLGGTAAGMVFGGAGAMDAALGHEEHRKRAARANGTAWARAPCPRTEGYSTVLYSTER